MKNILKNIFALIIFGIVIFVFRDSLVKSFFILQDKLFPCTRVISYSLGIVDVGFGIGKEDFLNIIKKSEDNWEASVNKDLFVYKEIDGELIINLIYDKRQENTQKLKVINKTLINDKSSYDNLKNQIDTLEIEYQDKKTFFESKIVSLKNHQGRYSEDNIALLNELQTDLNILGNKINVLINELNNSAYSINNQVKNYNTLGNEFGDEFEEGLYHSDQNGKYIDIYQFENKTKLQRVLMHEFGHALFLEHIDNPKAIMYRLNDGVNLTPTEDDINALKSHCRIK